LADHRTTSESRLRDRNGELLPARFRLTPVQDSDSELRALVLIEDVRPQQAAEAERMRLDARLRQSQKMDAVAQLTGGIAHDFNNMLTVILANAELLSAAIGADSAAQADLEELRAAARRGTAMVRKLLGFSRRERLLFQPLNLGQFLRDLANQLR